MNLEYKGEPEGTIKTFIDDNIFLDETIIRCLPKLRYSLVICRYMFSCYIVSVVNRSSKSVTINIGKSELGSRSIDCEKEKFGVYLKPGESHQFQFIKCFFGEEIFIETTDKNLFVSTKRLKECPIPKIIDLSKNN